jgi:hypothetical protein
MRWKAFKQPGPWSLWFAWRPVRVDNEVIWLEWVQRRRQMTDAQSSIEIEQPEPIGFQIYAVRKNGR